MMQIQPSFSCWMRTRRMMATQVTFSLTTNKLCLRLQGAVTLNSDQSRAFGLIIFFSTSKP